MKLIVIVGSESHTTSSASAKLETVIPQGDKSFWDRTPKAWEKQWETLERDGHANWYQLELDVPAGTRIRYVCKGRTGARGADKHEYIQEFIMDEAAEVVEETPSAGLRDCLIKGRMRIRKTAPKPAIINTESGF